MEITGSDKKGDSTKLYVAMLDPHDHVVARRQVAANPVGDGNRKRKEKLFRVL